MSPRHPGSHWEMDCGSCSPTPSWDTVGNMVFTAKWGNYSAYGKAMDKMVGDQSVQKLIASFTAAGTSEWVRSNLVREIPI